MSRAAFALAWVLSPALAEACATCIASPYGDRTYSWPYLMLILVPFGVAVVIAGVLARANGIGLGALAARVGRALHGRARRAQGAEFPAVRQGETT